MHKLHASSSVVAALLCLGVSAISHAQLSIKPTALVSRSSGKCANVEGASDADVAHVIQWVCDSPLRPHHPRRNWFVAVQKCEPPRQLPADGEIVFQACKASGKGGQHVNTTDSAVHALHVPSGISVKVMSERSQHANKRLARELLPLKLARLNAQGEGQARRTRSQQHWEVERGSPVKVFRA